MKKPVLTCFTTYLTILKILTLNFVQIFINLCPLTYCKVFENCNSEGEKFEKEEKLLKILEMFQNFRNFENQDSSFVALLILRHLILRQLIVALKLHPWRRFP